MHRHHHRPAGMLIILLHSNKAILPKAILHKLDIHPHRKVDTQTRASKVLMVNHKAVTASRKAVTVNRKEVTVNHKAIIHRHHHLNIDFLHINSFYLSFIICKMHNIQLTLHKVF
jgi:hypothetical protein